MNAIVFRENHWQEILAALESEYESAAVLIAGIARGSTDTSFLVRHVAWVDAEHYERRDAQGLSIRSLGYVRALKSAESDRAIAIFMHTHPRGLAAPSERDLVVDDSIRGLFAERTASGMYVSLIVGGDSNAPVFTGRVFERSTTTALDKIRVVGDRLQVLGSTSDGESKRFDRQILAFGTAGQQQLQRMHVGVVGVGGTGSAASEQLVRLGVGRLTVVDDDAISSSNLSRTHEAAIDDLGKPKTAITQDLARGVGSDTHVIAVVARVTDRDAAETLKHCDVVFGCTDDHSGRLVLSRLAYWYLTPVIDTGVLVQTDSRGMTGIYGRITTVVPGEPCLICRGRADPDIARSESLSTPERLRLAAEGYVPGLGEPAPSVIPYTTTVASLAVSELLLRLFGFAESPTPSELLVLFHEREVRRTRTLPTPGHYCATPDMWGRGDTVPFLGRTWTN